MAKKKGGLLDAFTNSFSNFRNSVPFLRKEECHWDDGTDEHKINEDESKGKFICAIFAVYGVLAGIIGCHYCKYLHQAINCDLWKVPLTSKKVPLYSVIGFLSDSFAFAFVYALAALMGVLVWASLKTIYSKSLHFCDEYCSAGMAYGLLCLVVTTIICAFIPFSIFLIGV